MANLLWCESSPLPSPRLLCLAYPIGLPVWLVTGTSAQADKTASLRSRATFYGFVCVHIRLTLMGWHGMAWHGRANGTPLCSAAASSLFSFLFSQTPSAPVVIDLAPAAAWPSREQLQSREKRSESDTSYVPSAGERILRAMLKSAPSRAGSVDGHQPDSLEARRSQVPRSKKYRLAS